jgi:rhomboid protease GluP
MSFRHHAGKLTTWDAREEEYALRAMHRFGTTPMNRQVIDFKLRRLLLPLIVLSAAFTLGYSFLNWLLVAKTSLIPLDEDIVDLWLPGALSWILVIILMQPRLRFLKIRDKRNNLPLLYHFTAVAVVAVPALVAQGYVKTATGDVTHVGDADRIATSPRTKFYVADNICMHLDKPTSHGFAAISGKGNNFLNFDFYLLAPICSTTVESSASRQVWLGFKYHHSMSNSASDAEKSSAYDSFVRQSLQAFNAEDPQQYKYLETLGRNSDRKRYEKTLQLADYRIAAPVILIPHPEPFEQRTSDRLVWLLASFAIGPLVWLIMVMIPSLDQSKISSATKPADPARPPPPSFVRNLFVPTRKFYGLPILIDTNIVIFLVMALSGLGVMSFDSDDLLAWGANYRPAIHGLGIFRVITSQFVHGGLVHLANNLYGLLFAGIFLTPVAINGRLIACYLLCGLGGSIASVIAHPATMSVGASGAIFGLFGILLTLVLFGDARLATARKFIFLNTGIFVGLNLLIGAATPAIDNAAHLGGLLTGALIGVALFVLNRFNHDRSRVSPHELPVDR